MISNYVLFRKKNQQNNCTKSSNIKLFSEGRGSCTWRRVLRRAIRALRCLEVLTLVKIRGMKIHGKKYISLQPQKVFVLEQAALQATGDRQ